MSGFSMRHLSLLSVARQHHRDASPTDPLSCGGLRPRLHLNEEVAHVVEVGILLGDTVC